MAEKLTKSQIGMLKSALAGAGVWNGKRPIGGARKNLRDLQTKGLLIGSYVTPAGRRALNKEPTDG